MAPYLLQWDFPQWSSGTCQGALCKACQQSESQQIQKRRGRPSSINSAQSVQVSSEPCQKDTRFTRSMAAPFKKEMCFFSKRTHLVKISMKFPPLMQASNSEMWWERATMKHGELILAQPSVQMMPVPLISSTTYHAGWNMYSVHRREAGMILHRHIRRKKQTLTSLHQTLSLFVLWKVSSMMAQSAWQSYARHIAVYCRKMVFTIDIVNIVWRKSLSTT